MILNTDINIKDYECKLILKDGTEATVLSDGKHVYPDERSLIYAVSTHIWCGVEGHEPVEKMKYYCCKCFLAKENAKWFASEIIPIAEYKEHMVYSRSFDEWIMTDELSDFIYDDGSIKHNEAIKLYEAVPIKPPTFSIDDLLIDTLGEDQTIEDIGSNSSMTAAQVESMVNDWLQSLTTYSYGIGKRKVILSEEYFSNE